MNRWTRRVSITLASAATAGGALLAAGGSASATTISQPVEHTPSSRVGIVHDGYHDGRYASDDHGERDDGGKGHLGSYTDDDRRGHHHDRPDHRKGGVRWDAHHRYVWTGNRWVEVTSRQHVGAERWYLDQVAWYLNQR